MNEEQYPLTTNHYSVGESCLTTTDEHNKKKTKKKEVDDSLIWVGDTGASSHMTRVWDGYYKLRPENSKAIFAQPDLTTSIKWGGEWK